jgi:fermentation-respiration switch protein FrsA (DUF1100 family)
VPKREVEFQSGSDLIRGDLYLPDGGDGPFPAIVLAGGWCYVKELRQPQYAEEFVKAGFAALVIDYRRLGASEGEPRQHLDPWDQIEDYKNAISYLETLTEVDSSRIGAWGISYSGGHVLILGATDPRVKCVVSNVAVVDGWETMWRVHGSERFRQVRQLIADDRAKRFSTGEYGYITMSGPTSETLATWPFEEVTTVFEELKRTQAPRHEHRSTVASVEKLLDYSVFPFLGRIVDTPTLMIVANQDDITMWDLETEVFNGIRTPKKKLAVLPDTSHMTLYSNISALSLAARWAAQWFTEHLLELPTVDRLLKL